MLTHQSLVLELVEEEVLTVLYGFVSFCFALFFFFMAGHVMNDFVR